MKYVRLHLVGIFLLAGLFFNQVQAQTSVSSQIFAEIIEALTATETAQLNFGKFFPQAEGGQVQVTPDGVRLAYGSVSLGGGSHSQASYEVAGEDGVSFTILLPQVPTVITNIDNSKTMFVEEWQSTPPPGEGSGQLIGGTQQVNVGATLSVGPIDENPVGMYAGTYSITFSYN
jgi:hypothetical protein